MLSLLAHPVDRLRSCMLTAVLGTIKYGNSENMRRRLTGYIKPRVTTVLSIPTTWRGNAITKDMIDNYNNGNHV